MTKNTCFEARQYIVFFTKKAQLIVAADVLKGATISVQVVHEAKNTHESLRPTIFGHCKSVVRTTNSFLKKEREDARYILIHCSSLFTPHF